MNGKTSIATKAWHQVTITRAGPRVRVYLDGRAAPEIDAEMEAAPANRLLIGSDGNPAATFDGKVDEIAVFDRALTGEEVADVYQISGTHTTTATEADGRAR